MQPGHQRVATFQITTQERYRPFMIAERYIADCEVKRRDTRLRERRRFLIIYGTGRGAFFPSIHALSNPRKPTYSGSPGATRDKCS